MNGMLAFLRARLAERSSRVQLVILVALAAVGTGYLTVDQIEGFTSKALAAVAVLGPLVTILMPETVKVEDKEAAMQAAALAAFAAAQAAAVQAAHKAAGPDAAARVEAEVAKVAEAADKMVASLGL